MVERIADLIREYAAPEDELGWDGVMSLDGLEEGLAAFIVDGLAL